MSNTRGDRPFWLRAAQMFLREVLWPVGVVIALGAIAVALIEGPPLEQFLYAVF